VLKGTLKRAGGEVLDRDRAWEGERLEKGISLFRVVLPSTEKEEANLSVIPRRITSRGKKLEKTIVVKVCVDRGRAYAGKKETKQRSSPIRRTTVPKSEADKRIGLKRNRERGRTREKGHSPALG